jgi:glycosyltransferase involved in cell wall biosynthesis
VFGSDGCSILSGTKDPVRRILHVICSVSQEAGGPVSTLRGLLSVWLRLGLTADVAASQEEAISGTELPCHLILKFQRTFPQRFWRSGPFEKWLSRCASDYDLVIVHGVWNFFSYRACSILRDRDCPYLLIPHGSLDPFDLAKKRLLKKVLGPLLVAGMLSNARAVLCSSRREAQRLVAYGAKANREVVFWPVSQRRLGERMSFRVRYGIPAGAFVFLFLSRIDYKKGLELIIPAFAEAARSRSNVVLVIAGAGEASYEQGIRALAARFLGGLNVIFTGFLSGTERDDAYAGADCFLLPSRNENFGHAVIEALVHDLPVVISREVYIDRFIEEYNCGWFTALDVQSLSSVLNRILTRPDEVRQKRAQCFRAAELFGIEKLAEAYAKVIERYAHGGTIYLGPVSPRPRHNGDSLFVMHVQGIFSPEHGGPAYSLANFCVEQARLGCRVSVRVLEGFPETSPARRLPEPIDQQTFRVMVPQRLGFSPELTRSMANDISADIYHLHGSWHMAMLIGAREARRRRRPYIVELMGSYTEYELRRKWVRKTIARRLYQDKLLQNAACLHVNSVTEGRMLLELGIKAPIACLPVGVDLSAVRRTLEESAGRGRVRVRPYVLYLGRIHPTKGIEPLLEAWRIARNRLGDWQLVVAGAGESRYVEKCRRAAEGMIRAGSVVWLGRVDDYEKTRLYRDAEVYVLPSLNENFGNTVAEAFACKTPVISTTNTHWTMIEDRECGWLATSDPESLVGALTRCFESGVAERKRRGERGHDFVERDYTIESVVENMILLYRGVLKGSLPNRLMVN